MIAKVEGSGASDGSGCVLNMLQLKRSRRAHRGALTRLTAAIQQGLLGDVQATFEFLIDRHKILSELDAQIQQLIEDDDNLVADMEDAEGC